MTDKYPTCLAKADLFVSSPLGHSSHMSLPISSSDLEDPAVFNLPGLKPPPGVTPDFMHPRNRGPVLIIVNGILLALMMILIATRFYTKLAIIRKVSWDDLTASLSALGAITLYILFGGGGQVLLIPCDSMHIDA